MLINCEVEGDPIPFLQLFNGPTLLSEKKGAISPFSLTYAHKLTCESYGVFSCLAAQGNRRLNKTFTVLLECAIQFNFPLDESKEHLINAQLNSEVSIVLGIFGHPWPNNYIILRGSSKFIFTNVTNGNTIGHGYTITYQQTNMPYGIINLTFKVSDRKDFTGYNFIIQNGINPPVVYNFLIVDEIQEVHKRFSIIIAICIPSIVSAIIIIVICVWRCRSNRATPPKSMHTVGRAFVYSKATVPEELDQRLSFASHLYEATPCGNVDLKTNSDQVIYGNA
ncbi:unnamed protein product [Lymnaea stagnalis]|uniref:Uncharacterized protein n=1 Tax=Lymnaea stagnalis TaxID=6523 RepID=A0AAV2IAE7_LYMST